MSQSPDLCIVGAGALGIDLALHARRLGANVVLARREHPEPGDAADAALRTAALAATAAEAQARRHGAALGLTSDMPKPVLKTIAERVNRLAEARDAAHDDAILGARGVTVMRGQVQFRDSRSLLVGDILVRPRHIVVAIGAAPLVPAIEGLDQIAFLNPDSIAHNTRKLTHLVVVGGGEAALELAQVHRRLGAAVTLVSQGPILPFYDREAVGILVRALVQEGVRVLDNAHVRKILPRAQGTGVMVEHATGEAETLDVSHVLVAMGRTADLAGLALDKARLRPGHRGEAGLVLGPLGQTSSRAVRFVGPAAGMEQWASARAHGRAVIDALVGGGPGAVPVIPRLVQTQPGLAQIGAFVDTGAKPRPGEQVLRANLGENDWLAARGMERGLIKLVARADGQILRGAVVAPEAGELAGVLALAMHKRLGLAALAELPLPRPGLLTSLQDLADGALPPRQPSIWLRLHRALSGLLPS
ncbi:MAG: FAD-dependent oxidoreductase [Devosia sp.]|nr:FAD-dependent oxidoreductase [Devosia sp.]